jgi:hypothetical protein
MRYRSLTAVMLWSFLAGLLVLSLPSWATSQDPTREEQLAEAKQDLADAQKQLRQIQYKKKQQIIQMDDADNTYVGETVFKMYLAACKYKQLKQRLSDDREKMFRDRYGYSYRDAVDNARVLDKEVSEKVQSDHEELANTPEYQKLQRDAVLQFQVFTKVRVADTDDGKSYSPDMPLSLDSALPPVINELRKGRGRNLDKLDKEEEKIKQKWREAQDRIQQLEQPKPVDPERYRAEEPGPLTVIAEPKEGYDMRVGEVQHVVLAVQGYKPPYRLSVTSLTGETTEERTLADRKPVWMPFSFPTPGTRTIYITIEQDEGRHRAQATLEFRVSEALETQEEEEEKPTGTEPPPTPPSQPQPPTQPPVKTPPKPAEKPIPFTPRKLAPGNYQAHLWIVPLSHFITFPKEHKMRPFPVTINFDAQGGVTGKGEWHVQDSERNPTYIADTTKFTEVMKCQIKGQVDWSNGRIELRVASEKRTVTEDAKQSPPFRLEWLHQCETKADGWQTGDPRFDVYLSAFEQYAGTAELSPENMEKDGYPNLEKNAQGKLSFQDFGWFGQPFGDKPMGGAKSHTLKYISTTDGYGGRKVDDQTASWQATEAKSTTDPGVAAQGRSEWYLKILGQAPDDPPPSSPKPEGDVVAFGIWPDEVRIKAGEPFQLDAMGVLAENVYDVVNFTQKAAWKSGQGLSSLGAGKFQATAPGTYTVRTGIKNKYGEWMQASVKVVVE